MWHILTKCGLTWYVVVDFMSTKQYNRRTERKLTNWDIWENTECVQQFCRWVTESTTWQSGMNWTFWYDMYMCVITLHKWLNFNLMMKHSSFRNWSQIHLMPLMFLSLEWISSIAKQGWPKAMEYLSLRCTEYFCAAIIYWSTMVYDEYVFLSKTNYPDAQFQFAK